MSQVVQLFPGEKKKKKDSVLEANKIMFIASTNSSCNWWWDSVLVVSVCRKIEQSPDQTYVTGIENIWSFTNCVWPDTDLTAHWSQWKDFD